MTTTPLTTPVDAERTDSELVDRVDEVSRPADPDTPGPFMAHSDAVFDRIARLGRSILGVTTVFLAVRAWTGREHLTVATGSDPSDTDLSLPLAGSLHRHLVRTGRPLVVNGAAGSWEPLLGFVPPDGPAAFAAIPIKDATGTTVGSLCAADSSTHLWTPSELSVLRDLAGAASAQLQLRRHALDAEHARTRTQLLLELSESLSGTTSETEIVAKIAALAVQRLGACSSGITLLDEAGATLNYVNTTLLHPVVERQFRSFALTADIPSAAVVRSGRPGFFASLHELGRSYPAVVRAAGLVGASFAYLPLLNGARATGSLVLTWSRERDFVDADRELLMAFARYVAQALDRAQLLHQRHEVALTLQQALLPQLPCIEGFELDGRYQPACADAAVGGDWYDAFPTSATTFEVVVGDVAGHDLNAAAGMGQLRAALRALALSKTGTPAAVLTDLDNVMNSLEPACLATAVLGEIATERGRSWLTWSNAGHPPALLLIPGRPAQLLRRKCEPLLGLTHNPVARTDHRIELPPGSTLLLFTDGLAERRGIDLDDRLDLLVRAVEGSRHLELAALLGSVLEAMRDPCHDDDTVLFAIRRSAS